MPCRKPLVVLLFVFMLAVSMTAIVFLSGCSNIGKYDGGKIVETVKEYYNGKYDVSEHVSAIHELISYDGLFGYHTTNTFFCTMTDGKCVKYLQAEGLCKDNRQQADAVNALARELYPHWKELGEDLASAGYTWEIDDVQGNNAAEQAFNIIDEPIHEYFDGGEGEDTWTRHSSDVFCDFQGAFFHELYDGDAGSFLAAECEHADWHMSLVLDTVSISGGDVPTALPENVPETPDWKAALDKFMETWIDDFNGNAYIFVENMNGEAAGWPYHRLGNCFASRDEGIKWKIAGWQEAEPGIWIGKADRDEGDGKLVATSDIDLAKLVADGKVTGNAAPVESTRAMELVADNPQNGSDNRKWQDFMIAYDPTAYSIQRMSRERLTGEDDGPDNANSNSNVNNAGNTAHQTTSSPVKLIDGDVGGEYGIIWPLSAYGDAGTSDASILFIAPA